jgi:hypothetical protein
VPAWLERKLDTSDVQFASLTKTLRGHEQKIGEIQARYQCQPTPSAGSGRALPPASSACNRPTCAQP